jgi:cyclic pyranopterin phosphate synthase
VIMRPALSLRVSVTDRCGMRCAYCMPAAGAPQAAREEALSYEEIVRFVRALRASYGLAHVRLTGGEPLVRAEIGELVTMLRAAGVADIALTTNGQRLAERAESLRQAGLNRINISLDSLNAATFAAITCGGVLEKTLAGIAAARRAGLDPIKLNMVVLRGQNDHEAADLVRFSIQHGCQMRFLELMPIGAASAGFEERFVPSAEVRTRLAREFTLAELPVDPQATSRDFVAEDGRGRPAIVGFISPSSEPFCAGCRRLRLTAAGVLIGCLARSEGVPLAPLLRGVLEPDTEALCSAVEQALGMKRRNREFLQPWAMVGIGG